VQVSVEVPDVKGRIAILGVHAKNKRLDDEVDLQQIALRTPGFTGARRAALPALLGFVARRAARVAWRVCARRVRLVLVSGTAGSAHAARIWLDNGCVRADVQRTSPPQTLAA
jgi:hypothetical protein